ncbi:hypothetical protein [Palleronia caenipelagi]|uniref:Uncharacterized protein n=1 Tax=Palleronia caenipelagi TaxID=2489174 RepID=A0A547PK09_9RHOB|nr:hypothetical protein [Palleronia caenipelagi]TRD14441.1 hypothetical protein FEV53_18915 [Palleronia caenipelagi]
MTLRLKALFTGLIALLMAALFACAPAGAKTASGGYQLFKPVTLADQCAIQLASFENFNQHAKIAPECCNAPKGGTTGAKGSLTDSANAQVKAKPGKAFTQEGQQKYSDLAGERIETVEDLTNAIKSGKIDPADIEANYVTINGKPVIDNARTSTALENAGFHAASGMESIRQENNSARVSHGIRRFRISLITIKASLSLLRIGNP